MVRRSIPILAALSLLAACGDDPDGPGALPVLRVGTGSGAPEGLANVSADAALSGEKAMYVPANWEFVVRGDLPALDSDAIAYVFPQGSEPISAQLNSLLDAFGMEGSFTKTTTDAGTEYEWTTWSVGPNDGSGPSITVSDDGLLSWWYSEGWQEMAVGRPAPEPDTATSDSTSDSSSDSSGGSSSDSAIVPPDAPSDEWVEPTPPENVPSASEAETKFRELFARLGFGADQMIVESYGDDWSAGAWAYVVVDGVRSSLSLSASFGENGRLTYAGGYLGRPDVLATYPRVGTTAGLDRLRDDYGAIMAPAVGLPAMEDGAVVETVVPETVPGDSVPADSVPADSIPVETVPDETITPDTITPETVTPETVTPETITVEIVGVEEEYILYWSVDGEVYLVPGYTFVAAEDEWGYRGRYTVPAIPSEYLDVVQPTGMAEPMPVEPEPVLPGGDGVIGIAPEDAERLIGLSEVDAVTEAESQGWDVRVVSRDGEDFPITMDYSTGRVNLTVEDDVVTKVYVG